MWLFILISFIVASISSHIDSHYWSWGSSATRWSIWVYRREAGMSQKGCAVICKYEAECDYHVFWNNECCFGRFTYSGSQFTTSSETVYFKIGNEALSVSSFYDDKNGNEYDTTRGLMDDYWWKRNIYHTNTETSDLESRCAKKCLVTHDDTCNYYTVNGGYCQLARFNYGSTLYKGTFDDYTVFQLKKSINMYSMQQSQLSSSNRACTGSGFHHMTYNGYTVS